jgi:hypothetical protein
MARKTGHLPSKIQSVAAPTTIVSLKELLQIRKDRGNNGKKMFAKRKPPSDFLINIGFARTLIPFDSRMKSIFRKVFRLSVSDKKYEPLEDFFLRDVYPRFELTPAQFDRIVFNHYKDLLS